MFACLRKVNEKIRPMINTWLCQNFGSVGIAVKAPNIWWSINLSEKPRI
jgi:hypothetical protein